MPIHSSEKVEGTEKGFFRKALMGFIYKITNTVSKKCYIGETIQSNPEERWKGHQTAILRGAGCPALGDAIRKYGADKFTFEVLIICFDEDRFHYEREYIKKFNAVVPNGYNILEGGEGGGFKGKRHTELTKKLIGEKHKELYAKNPDRAKSSRIRALKQMAEVNKSGIDWGNKVKGSEKFKKAKEEGRIGGAAHSGDGHLKMETKEKISESLKKYYNENENKSKLNTEKHRNAMAKARGVRVQQYTKEGVYIKTYNSIQDASREHGMNKQAIRVALDKPTRSSGGFVWKRENVVSHVEA